MGFIAFKLQSIVLGILAVFLLAGIPRKFALAKLVKRIRQNQFVQTGELDRQDVALILNRLAQDIPDTVAPSYEKALPKLVSKIWKSVTKKHPKPLTTILLTALYVGLIFVAIPFSYGFLIGIKTGRPESARSSISINVPNTSNAIETKSPKRILNTELDRETAPIRSLEPAGTSSLPVLTGSKWIKPIAFHEICLPDALKVLSSLKTQPHHRSPHRHHYARFHD